MWTPEDFSKSWLEPEASHSNQCVEIEGVGYSWSVLLKKPQLSLLFWRSLMWTMPHAEEPSEDLHIVDLHEARKGNGNSSFKSLNVHGKTDPRQMQVQRCCYCPSAWSSCKDGCKSAEQKISRPSQKSLAHAHTLFEKSTSKTLKKNGFSRWTPQRKPQKSLLHVWSLQKCTWMSCSMTLTRRRKATTEMLQRKKIRLLEWPRVPTSRCCGAALGARNTAVLLRKWMNRNSFVKRSGPKFLLTVKQVSSG